MTFTLDTSGGVARPLTEDGYADGWLYWSDLSPFAQGYIEAALLSASLDTAHTRDCEYVTSEGPAGCTCPAGRFGYRRPIRFDWLAPETLASMLADCAFPDHRREWENGLRREDGAAFWRNRQAGQWPSLSPVTLILADDGKVRRREAGQ